MCNFSPVCLFYNFPFPNEKLKVMGDSHCGCSQLNSDGFGMFWRIFLRIYNKRSVYTLADLQPGHRLENMGRTTKGSSEFLHMGF